MLRQLASRVARFGSRGISTTAARLEGEAAPAGLKEFSEAWTASAPSTMVVPDTNEAFMEQKGDGQSLADGEKFPVNFYTPYGILADSKVRTTSMPRAAPLLPAMRAAPRPGAQPIAAGLIAAAGSRRGPRQLQLRATCTPRRAALIATRPVQEEEEQLSPFLFARPRPPLSPPSPPPLPPSPPLSPLPPRC
jgi:hypothetical protein